ncbi:uncharacterized protein LOC120646007 [Panicum virgatum]|uniref:uncharacterized protein LOC120646007 n=1 Tax=Panicum virgatum TaxID=38727 RepID=UPI0019D69181|nr:uncharacterized protein LOC120646007 [Panicum virgatum]
MAATREPPTPYLWSDMAISFSLADQWLDFDHPGKFPLLVSPVVQESRLKKVLIDCGSSINVLFPKTLLELDISFDDLKESDSPFFGIMPGDGEYLLGHISLLVTFGTPENFRTETLRFEVATFNSYNAIIGRPGLAKFMAVPHYSYLVVKMPAPRGVISMRADFKGMADCTRKALQTALKASASAPQRRLVADAAQLLKDDLTIPTHESVPNTVIHAAAPTKEVSLDLPDASKKATISAILSPK